MQSANPYSQWIPIAVIVVVLALRSRQIGRERPFRPALSLILPVIALAGITAMLITRPPAPLGWAALGAGLVLGVPLGWQRAKFTHIGRDPVTGALFIRQSAAAMMLLIGVIVLRQFARYEMIEAGAAHAEWLALASDALIGFAVGSICTFRGELYVRARSILAA
ncbi:CcdC protein domain-containing protein [Novosphingobium sp.]|uniref:CcdC protein domain-containing protein n=1 Tax=Novosphingobium sp. TaxID=1874826 RepID=UPI0031CEE055